MPFDAGVVPVLHEAVKVLEEPPERGAGRKEQNKAQRSAQHQAAAAAFDGQGVDRQDKSRPDGQKGVGLEMPEPVEPLPGEEPGAQAQGQAGPSPPGEVAGNRDRFGRFRLPFMTAANRPQQAADQQQVDHCKKDEPGP
jgi:hypothetical protein